METVTIVLCAKSVEWHDQNIYLSDGWNLQPADDFLGIKGSVISKQVSTKPDWLDMSEADAKEIGIQNITTLGFWILEINDRTGVACFGGSEIYLTSEKLDPNFQPYRIEVETGKLKNEVLGYMNAATSEPLT